MEGWGIPVDFPYGTLGMPKHKHALTLTVQAPTPHPWDRKDNLSYGPPRPPPNVMNLILFQKNSCSWSGPAPPMSLHFFGKGSDSLRWVGWGGGLGGP